MVSRDRVQCRNRSYRELGDKHLRCSDLRSPLALVKSLGEEVEEETAGGTRRRSVAKTADVIGRREVDRQRHRHRTKDRQHHAGQHPYELLSLHFLCKGIEKWFIVGGIPV